MISPITPLLQREGVDIALVSVEIWPTETVVRLAGLLADPIAEDASHGAELDAWAAAGRNGPPPRSRGERVLERVEVSLTDDVGTPYQWKTRSAGGSSRPFRGDWWFPTGVPETARLLTVVAEDQETGETATTELHP